MDIEEVLKHNFTHMTEEYRQFATAKSQCKLCSVYDAYKTVTQSEGNAKNPTFMLIGECPGELESEQGRPFVGKAGQKLRDELRKHNSIFNKNTTIITNTLPCRPPKNSFPSRTNGPHFIIDAGQNPAMLPTRDGTLISTCVRRWLMQEIMLLKPKIIVTLGAKALEYVRSETGITDCRGKWKQLTLAHVKEDGCRQRYKVWSMATFHPSYVLRCQNDEDRLDIVQDFVDDIEKVATTSSLLSSSVMQETPCLIFPILKQVSHG